MEVKKMPKESIFYVPGREGKVTLVKGRKYDYNGELLEFWGVPAYNTAKDRRMYRFHINNATGVKTLYLKDMKNLKEL
jgi:hypothetical protein